MSHGLKMAGEGEHKPPPSFLRDGYCGICNRRTTSYSRLSRESREQLKLFMGLINADFADHDARAAASFHLETAHSQGKSIQETADDYFRSVRAADFEEQLQHFMELINADCSDDDARLAARAYLRAARAEDKTLEQAVEGHFHLQSLHKRRHEEAKMEEDEEGEEAHEGEEGEEAKMEEDEEAKIEEDGECPWVQPLPAFPKHLPRKASGATRL